MTVFREDEVEPMPCPLCRGSGLPSAGPPDEGRCWRCRGSGEDPQPCDSGNQANTDDDENNEEEQVSNLSIVEIGYWTRTGCHQCDADIVAHKGDKVIGLNACAFLCPLCGIAASEARPEFGPVDHPRYTGIPARGSSRRTTGNDGDGGEE